MKTCVKAWYHAPYTWGLLGWKSPPLEKRRLLCCRSRREGVLERENMCGGGWFCRALLYVVWSRHLETIRSTICESRDVIPTNASPQYRHQRLSPRAPVWEQLDSKMCQFRNFINYHGHQFEHLQITRWCLHFYKFTFSAAPKPERSSVRYHKLFYTCLF